MDMFEVSRRLTGSMDEENVRYCGEEESFHRLNTLFQHMTQKEKRLQRLNRLSLAGMLLISAVVVLFLLGVFGGSRQCGVHDDSHSPGISFKHQQQIPAPEIPAALLTDYNHSAEEDILKWKHMAYSHGGFNYSDGYLVVPRPGYYTIYLQITYENIENFECDDDAKHDQVLTLEAWVRRVQQSYKKPVTLLSMEETVDCKWKVWKKSLYTSSVFLLETNDILWVTSSWPELIVQTGQLVFFGAKLEVEQPSHTAGIT